MTIRIKLLILIVMLCVPLLVNLAVLGLLTRTVTRSVHQLQDVAVDQQAGGAVGQQAQVEAGWELPPLAGDLLADLGHEGGPGGDGEGEIAPGRDELVAGPAND